MGRGRGHWEERLRAELTTGTVVVGVGNLLRGDDGVGVIVARKLAQRTGLQVFDAGGYPENIIGKLCERNPQRVIVVDSVAFDAEPGTIAWFGAEEVEGKGVSSHTPSMELFARMVETQTGAHTVVLGIQGGSNTFGAPLCAEVANAANEVTDAFERKAGELKEKGSVTGDDPGEPGIEGRLLARLEHGLRAPLCGVQACLRVVEQGLLGEINDRQRELVQRAISRTSMMLSTVTELVDLSRIPDRVPAERLRTVKGTELGEWVKTTFTARAEEGGMELTVNRESMRFSLRIDKGLFTRLLSELMENALAYSRKGGRILIEGEVAGSEACLTITDTGIGVRVEDCEEAFNEFVRGSNAKALRPEGTGLGLPIARRIAQAHEGIISLSSRLDSGTTMKVCLPQWCCSGEGSVGGEGRGDTAD